jgi:hypothetical protein
MLTKLTVDDFDVEKSEGGFGPIWVVTPKVRESEWDTKKYILRSDVKMDKGFYQDPSRATPGVHLDVSYSDSYIHGDWKGIYDTADMDEALQSLIDDINLNNQLDVVERRIEGAISELSVQLDDLNKATVAFARFDLDESVDNVVAAFTNLMLRYNEVREEMENLGW